MSLPVGAQRVRDAAAARSIAIEIRPRPAVRSLEEAAAALGVTAADIAKTLVVRLPGDRFVFAVVGGDRQIAWPKLRALAGVNKMSLPPADEALRATGYSRGTITPIGSAGDWPVYVDERLTGHRVVMGAGDPGYSAFVGVDDLVRAYAAVVADLSDPV